MLWFKEVFFRYRFLPTEFGVDTAPFGRDGPCVFQTFDELLVAEEDLLDAQQGVAGRGRVAGRRRRRRRLLRGYTCREK